MVYVALAMVIILLLVVALFPAFCHVVSSSGNRRLLCLVAAFLVTLGGILSSSLRFRTGAMGMCCRRLVCCRGDVHVPRGRDVDMVG